jgi:predicted MFS family arabinose efflux permease
MLSAIGLGSIIGAFTLSCLPAYYPRHHLIPLSMCIFAAIGLVFSLSTAPALSLLILVGSGMFWLLSLNPINTANQLLATDENRGRVMSVMLLAHQGGMPLGHLFAGFLTHYLSPQWVLRLMLGTLLAVMMVFLFMREPEIDNLRPARRAEKLSMLEAIWEAITAYSHRPAYPAGVDLHSEQDGVAP